MATEFTMPKLGLTMEAGTILEWLVDDGASVGAGTPVLRIETDKVETDVEASGSGRLHQVGVVGDTYDCGAGIGWFLAEGEEPPAVSAPPPPSVAPTAVGPSTDAAVPPAVAAAPGGRILASPNARRVAAERGVALSAIAGTGPGGRIVSEDVERAGLVVSPAAAATTGSGPGVPATMAARLLADLLGVDLARVPGVEARRTRDDVARYVRAMLDAAGPAPALPDPTTTSAPLSQEPTSTVALRGMRGTIATRMHQSLREMAQLTLNMDVDMDTVVAHREAGRQVDELPLPGYTDYVIASAARALVEHPLINSQVTDDAVALLPDVHVGMAVAVDGGLVVPVVRDTASLTLAELTAETTRLAQAARAGALTLAEMEGGTFSVSTLGMYGVDGFTPVINPPNTAILGVGRLRQEVVVDGPDTAPRAVTRMTLSLTWDHRAFDGAPAAEFARTIKRHLEADWA